MKKLVTLMLTLLLCTNLTAPALAAYPKTPESANKKYAISTTMDQYKNLVKERTQLYYREYLQNPTTGRYEDMLVEDAVYDDYRVIGSDTGITVSNTGKGIDYFVMISHVRYVKDDEGRYVMSDQCESAGCSMRNNGEFLNREVNENWGSPSYQGVNERHSLMKLASGESYTFTGAELSCSSSSDSPGTMYVVSICQYYTEIDKTWDQSTLYMVDDAKAALISGKTTDTEELSNPFTDVPANSYYHEAVLWALDNGITTGTSATTFGPTATCTRSQVATFLWRAMGCPEPKTKTNPFSDVKKNDYFYKAVLWAYENGITTGSTKTTFDPNGTCTSAHVVTFLWRANGKPTAEYTGSAYYAEAVAWANNANLLAGTDIPFAPQNNSPRADIVTYLYRNLAR